mgnify:CR=1 FL=1
MNLNISFDTLYSGTIGACLQALTYRVPAIAFSTESEFFDVIDEHFDLAMEYILKNNMLSTEYLINVNYPVSSTIKGIKETKVFYRKENAYYVKQPDGTFLALRDIKDKECTDEQTDTYAVYHSYISISRLNKIL